MPPVPPLASLPASRKDPPPLVRVEKGDAKKGLKETEDNDGKKEVKKEVKKEDKYEDDDKSKKGFYGGPDRFPEEDGLSNVFPGYDRPPFSGPGYGGPGYGGPGYGGPGYGGPPFGGPPFGRPSPIGSGYGSGPHPGGRELNTILLLSMHNLMYF